MTRLTKLNNQKKPEEEEEEEGAILFFRKKMSLNTFFLEIYPGNNSLVLDIFILVDYSINATHYLWPPLFSIDIFS